VHTVDVDASSVYEALALAVAEFRSDTLLEPPSTLTEFTISIPARGAQNSIGAGNKVGRGNP
jgi:hypothetical protein